MSTLAYVIHMVTIQLHYSLSLQEFFANLFPLITFDMLPAEIWYEYIFNLSQYEDEPKSDNFDLVGYGSTIVFNNCGSLLIFPLIDLVSIVTALSLLKVPEKYMFKIIRNKVRE